MNYQDKRKALETAAQIVDALPYHTVFGVAVTNDEDDAELNIYLGPQEHQSIISLLRLADPVESGERFTTYQVGPLTVSIVVIEEESHE